MTVYIVRRETRTKGTRWHVRCELKNMPLIHLGVFDTERRAKMRREVALNEIAKGQIPARLGAGPEPTATRTVAEVGEAWLLTRHDLAERTMLNYRRDIRTLPDWLATMNPEAVTYVHVQAWVTELAKTLSRGSIARMRVVLRQVFDYAGVNQNAAADRRVRLPRGERTEHKMPNREELAAVRRALPSRAALLTLIEHTGLRISEAADLRWQDIDYQRGRLLVTDSKTKSGRRFVKHLEGTPAFPVMPEGEDPSFKVFREPSPHSLTAAVWHSHHKHGTPLFNAHALRHLHVSRLLHDGILSPAQIAERIGHASPDITLRAYSHVVPPED